MLGEQRTPGDLERHYPSRVQPLEGHSRGMADGYQRDGSVRLAPCRMWEIEKAILEFWRLEIGTVVSSTVGGGHGSKKTFFDHPSRHRNFDITILTTSIVALIQAEPSPMLPLTVQYMLYPRGVRIAGWRAFLQPAPTTPS